MRANPLWKPPGRLLAPPPFIENDKLWAILFFAACIVVPSAAVPAEPKLLNIGLTGGTAWTALPDRSQPSAASLSAKAQSPLRSISGTNLVLSTLMAHELEYVTILPFIAGAAARGLPVRIVGATTEASAYAIVSRPDIDNVKALRGKRIAINTLDSSEDFAIYQVLTRNGFGSAQRRRVTSNCR